MKAQIFDNAVNAANPAKPWKVMLTDGDVTVERSFPTRARARSYADMVKQCSTLTIHDFAAGADSYTRPMASEPI